MGRGRKPGRRAVYQVGHHVAGKLRIQAKIDGVSMGDVASAALLALAKDARTSTWPVSPGSEPVCIRLSPEAMEALELVRDLSGAGPSAVLGVALLRALDKSPVPSSD